MTLLQNVKNIHRMKVNLTNLTDHSLDSKTEVYNICSPSYYYKSELNSVTDMLQGQFFVEQEEEEEEEEEEDEEENYAQNGPDEDEFILPL
jgi:hypothetical protein